MDRFEKAGKAFERLCRIMARLRAPGGCPWDAEQTIDSLKPYLIEEAYEVLEAIERDDAGKHREELGDLLLQVVFQAEVTQEQPSFDITDVVDSISEKLLRRHPHVFSDATAKDATGALRNWESVKARERGADESVLDGIPPTLPALLRALRTGEKAAAVGFDWPSIEGVEAKVDEELRELRAVLAADNAEAARYEEMGDLLFALVNWARHLGIDAEAALRDATHKFARRFRRIERDVGERGLATADVPLDELERIWERVKAEEDG